ncbi:MAG: hypothetical protein KY433_02115, partial [Actinobacteria bacterium]|nr:hypothetical protein [Actinomycetota bacterium]
MSDTPLPLWFMVRPLLAALVILGAVAVAPATAGSWKLEPIGASNGVAELQDLAFDAQGRALLSWSAARHRRMPPLFAGLATR